MRYLFWQSCLALCITAALIANPQAVIFDCGGVMKGKTNIAQRNQELAELFHLTKEEFAKANVARQEAVVKGISDYDFWSSYAKHATPALYTTLQDILFSSLNVRSSMYELVACLQQEVQVGLLSNMSLEHAQLYTQLGLLAPFYPCLLSYQTGFTKPDSKAYLFMLQELQMNAQDVVFIDDRLCNVVSAQQLGIDAIQFLSVPQIIEELKKRGLLNILSN